jgi:hypothetical protein
MIICNLELMLFTRNQEEFSSSLIQNNACLAKSSCVNERRNRARLKLNDTIFFFDFVKRLMFSASKTFQKMGLLPSSSKEAPNMLHHFDQIILNHLHRSHMGVTTNQPTKGLTRGRDLRFAQVDVPSSV